MEWILIAILLPELLMITVGFVRVIMSFLQTGDFENMFPDKGPRSGKVSSSYWGSYTAVAPAKTGQIALPKIVKPYESEVNGKDWTG